MSILPSFSDRRPSIWSSIPIVRPISHQQNLSIPSNYQLMDISKDKKFMAIVDSKLNLQVYGISCDESGINLVSQIIQDVECKIDSHNSLFAFLSVADKTGYVAISYAQLDSSTGLFLQSSIDSNYTNCTVYKETKDGKVRTTNIPLQGRAVFIEDKLAIVGNWTLTIIGANMFSDKYFLDLSELKRSYEGMIGAQSFGSNMSWAKHYLFARNMHCDPNRKDGDDLIALTQHIRNNILVTTYRGNNTKVWSILDGSLIASFKTLEGEYIMAISESNQFIATYSSATRKVRVYCTKSVLLLHEYTPKCMEDEENKGTVHFVKFDKCKHYLLITGTKDNQPNNQSNNRLRKQSNNRISNQYNNRPRFQPDSQPDSQTSTQQTLFFEVWSISQEKRIVYREKKATVETRMPLPFVFEDFHDLTELQDDDSYRYFDTNFYGVYMTRETENESSLKIKGFPLLLKEDKQDLHEFNEEMLWNTYPFIRLSKKQLRLRNHFDEMTKPLDNKDKALGYLIKNGDDRFILRFNLNMVQLWKLEEVKKDTVEEKDLFDFKPFFKENPAQRLRARCSQTPVQDQNQDEDRYQEDKKYYNTFKKSTLVYIRAYKGQHYLPLSTFRENWKMTQDKDQNFYPKVSFMKEKGRILIEIEHKGRTTKDEIFLRIPDSRTEFSCELNGSSSASSTTVSSRVPVNYHEIESFSQALHYLYSILKKKHKEFSGQSEVLQVGNLLFKETNKLLRGVIFAEKGTNYFNTVSGSKTLAMLASFPPGQNIIYDMTKCKPCIPMKIFSYATETKKSENLLTVLIQGSKYDLFQLLFNLMIMEYYTDNTGNLSAFIDVLLCLQDEQSLARLLTCIQSLSYLPVRFNKSALMDSEYYKMHTDTPADEDESSNLEYRGCFTALEQINKYNYGFLRKYWSLMVFNFRKWCQQNAQNYLKMAQSQQLSITKNSEKARVCLVPLPYFNSYRIFPEESLMENLTKHHKNSLFTRTALSDTENKIFRQGYTVMEVLVTYKWKAFARDRFIIILLLQVTYYASFSIGVALAEEIFGYVPGHQITHPGQILSLVVALLLGLFLLIQEYRQWKVARWFYLKSFYNYLDLASFLLPLATFFLLRFDSTGLYEVSAISTLVLWIHFILRLRVFRTVGYLLEMVIQLSAKIVPVTFVMILVVIAFTHSFFVLLRKRGDLFIEDASNNDGDADNIFSNVFFAFITVWFFIFGVFDPLFEGELGRYPMALILAVVFSLIIVLILFNVVIALMSGKVEEISTTGTKCWIGHHASVVAEIELFWCFLSQRLSKNNNPIYVYYNANRETVEAHHKAMKKEVKKLKKDLEKIQKDTNEMSFEDDE